MKIEEIFPCVEKYIRRKLKLKKGQSLTYTSNTTFLTFRVDEQKDDKISD